MKKILATILACLFLTTTAHADITTGLIGWWKFEEGGGTIAVDSSGMGNNGTLVGGPTYVVGKIGSYCLSFNGTSQYVNLGTLGSIGSNISNVSVSAWVFSTQNTVTNNVIGTTNSGTTFAQNLSLQVNQNDVGVLLAGSVRSALIDNTTPLILSGGTNANNISINTWHLIVATDNSSTNTIVIYVDGVSKAIVYQDQQTPVTYTNFTSPMLIGAFNKAGTINQFFAGNIDDVRIYNRVLSASDVAQLFLNHTNIIQGNSIIGGNSIVN